jgi:uncharacterized damage-inducible protein DinB
MSTAAPFDSAVLETARIRLTHDYPMAIGGCLEALDDNQLWWRPNEEANAIANLVIHLAGSNHFYLEHVFAGRALRRDRDAEFAARGTHTKAQLIDLWQGSVSTTADVLESCTPERLGEVTQKTGRPLTLERILLHVTHHNAIHMGQIVFTTKMLREGSIRDLWKRTRAL